MLEQKQDLKGSALANTSESRKIVTPQVPSLCQGRLACLGRFETPIRWAARNLMRPAFKTGAKMIAYEHLDESLDELNDLLDKNSMLIIATNHGSHSDILVGIEMVRRVKSTFPWLGDFNVPIAASLARGIQGPIAQLFYSEGTLPLLKQQNINPLALVTENDQNKRGLKPNREEIRQLITAPTKPGSAFFDLAAGSVEEGRYDALKHMKGIPKVTNSFLSHIFQKAHDADKKVIVLPAGISGTNQLFSAESLFLTPQSTIALLKDWILRIPTTLARVVVGHPYEYVNKTGESLTNHVQAVNDFVMQSIAELKPVQERGYYHPVTREYQLAMQAYEKKLAEQKRLHKENHPLLQKFPFLQKLYQPAQPPIDEAILSLAKKVSRL